MSHDMNNSKMFETEDPANDSGNDSDSEKPARRSGRRKIKIEYIEDKNRRHITFSKRKAGIMKKAYELSTLTGTQVLLLVVSETGLVYTFTTVKLQPIVTKPEGKNLIQACLNAPDPSEPSTSGDASYSNTSPQVNDAKSKFEDTKPEPPKQELTQPPNTRYGVGGGAPGYASSQYAPGAPNTNNTGSHLPYNYPTYQQSSQQQPSQYGMQQPFYGNQQPHYMSSQQQQPGYWQQQQQQPQQQQPPNTNPQATLTKQEEDKSRIN
ncbi:transcription factor of the MADS box [Rhizopus azygosporus]|uniref:Transcription factor of the MADS box n=2 Tax=Rhizopus TaxID=4842 RepID=A0A367K7P3_RHIAZ|nr:SRF-TF-domain-containing protein [Rhizopus microsporus]RCH98195.1 transcription factor of the MADS box [Rhizopus azygosporus]CEG72956.1 Putative MADS-box transcription factor, other eukaryote [Rhizopus microsporus]CEJ00641.1 Putative MADS-box transcription factor, other eukaryote [Rhizopus microsporus]